MRGAVQRREHRDQIRLQRCLVVVDVLADLPGQDAEKELAVCVPAVAPETVDEVVAGLFDKEKGFES